MDFIKGSEQVKIDPSGIDISGASNILLKSDGKIGIGTNNPQYPLQVNGTQSIFSNTPEILLFKEEQDRTGPILSWGNTTYTDWKIKSDTTGLNIASGSNSVANTHMNINNTGNVGIGTSTPEVALSVYGPDINGNPWDSVNNPINMDSEPVLKMSRKSNLRNSDGTGIFNDSAMSINLQRPNNAALSYPYTTAHLNLTSGTNSNSIETNNTIMTLVDNGNVGIGSTSPTEKLEVDGNIKANGFKIPVILFGNVKSDGAIEDAGSGGWSSSRSATGKYTVTFTTSFSVKPTVVITQVHGGYSTTTHTIGSLFDNSIINGIDTQKFYCSLGGGGGELSSRDFCFMAMGYI